LLVNRIIKNYLTDFHKIQWKDGTWTMEELLDFDGNPDHNTLGFWLYGAETPCSARYVLPGICFIGTVVQDQWP